MSGKTMVSIKELDTPAKLTELRKDNKDSRSRLEILWKLGIAFYRGRQYTYYSTALRRIQQLPVDDLKARGKTRVVSNQIKPNCNKLVAKLTKNKAQFTASSGNGDPKSAKAARLAESAAEYWWVAFDLQRKYRQALTWARVAGQGYWFLTWNPYAGEPFSYVEGPGGEILNGEMAPLYQDQLEAHGLSRDHATRTAYMGDIDVSVPSPLNVWLDNTVEQFEDCRYFGIDLHLDPEEVYTRWKYRCDADSVITDADLGAQTSDLDQAKKTVVVVSALFIRPCPSCPTGRVVYWHKDRILEDNKKWPFPFKHLPLVKFGATPIPNSPYDSGEVEDAIPLNKELNKTLSQILTHRDQTINPKWTVPRNAVQAFNTADEVQYYNPVSNAKPEMVQHPSLPAYMADILADMNARIKNAFGLGDTNTNTAQHAGLESGIALDLAQEESDEVIAPIVVDNEISLGKALQMCLDFAVERYTTERLLQITGDNGMPQIIAFRGAAVKGVQIKCEASSSMPRSAAGKMARVMMMLQQGLIDKDEVYKYIDQPDLKDFKRLRMLDADMADREHMRILNGQPVNPVALQEAQGHVSTGVNPDTGNPFVDQAEIQGFLLQAMLKPTPYENLQAHYNFHTQYMKSVEFESLPPQLQHEFVQHTELTLQALQAMNQPPSQAKVTMGLHMVPGAETAAAVLEGAGVKVDPETIRTEAPLESLVMQTDSLDKPNADSGTPSASSTSQTTKAAKDGKNSSGS